MWSFVTRISAEQRQATSNQLLIHEAHRTNGQAVHLLMVSHDLPLMREPAEKLAGSCAEAAKIGLKARESCANRLNYFHFAAARMMPVTTVVGFSQRF